MFKGAGGKGDTTVDSETRRAKDDFLLQEKKKTLSLFQTPPSPKTQNINKTKKSFLGSIYILVKLSNRIAFLVDSSQKVGTPRSLPPLSHQLVAP